MATRLTKMCAWHKAGGWRRGCVDSIVGKMADWVTRVAMHPNKSFFPNRDGECRQLSHRSVRPRIDGTFVLHRTIPESCFRAHETHIGCESDGMRSQAEADCRQHDASPHHVEVQPDERLTLETLGPFFSGVDPPPLTAEESRLRKCRPSRTDAPVLQGCKSQHLNRSDASCHRALTFGFSIRNCAWGILADAQRL
jgi:hypothetical protein